MTVNKAKKIISDNGIFWTNVIELNNRVNLLSNISPLLNEAVARVNKFIYNGN